MTDSGFLVWIAGPRGPVAQKWANPPASAVEDYWKHRVLLTVALPACEFGLSIDALAAKYPAPPGEDAGEKIVIGREGVSK